ncbi:HAD domain-containing protein [Actinopolymorpha sp. B9G3]|uniref:HAD domain-containing protein n=1 Tax=Actinopolymorpha sp. B9G3 TaxID=3158970 RepID=UPI0032D8C3A1
MADHARRPLLFLDVDGTLLPVGGVPRPSPIDWGAWQDASNPQLAKLDPAHGPLLRALSCELVWATAWMHGANEVIAPLLGLPELPVADLPDAPEEDDFSVLHWKTKALVEAAAGRPFIWVDDEIGELDRSWVTTHHHGPALLHRVDSQHGLTLVDFDTLNDWLRRTPSAQAEPTN